MRYHEIMSEAAPPRPLPANIADAIEHADSFGGALKLRDFTLRYVGYLTVDEIGEFDDTYGWLESHEPDDMENYRQGSFKGEPREMPPIIIISAPDDEGCHTQVGDGRGRVNFANAHGLRLHVWHLIHKKCRDL